MQFVLNVEKNVKSHSNLTKTDLYTAENALLKRDPREVDTKLQASICSQQHFLFFLELTFNVQTLNTLLPHITLGWTICYKNVLTAVN